MNETSTPAIPEAEVPEVVNLKTKYPVKFVSNPLSPENITIEVGGKRASFTYPNQPGLLILSDEVRAYISAVYPSEKQKVRVRIEQSPEGYDKTGTPKSKPEQLVKYKEDYEIPQKSQNTRLMV